MKHIILVIFAAAPWTNLIAQTKYVIDNLVILNSGDYEFGLGYASETAGRVVFSSSRENSFKFGEDLLAGEIDMDLFQSFLDEEGRWGTPEPLTSVINSEFQELDVAFDKNYDNIYFTRCVASAKESFVCDLYRSSMTGGRFGPVKVVELINRNQDDSSKVGNPAFTVDNDYLMFVSDMPGGYGGKDIWYVEYNNQTDTFGEAVNMGPEINSNGDEMYPTMRFDGALFFSSDTQGNTGGWDIMMALPGDGLMKFQPPKALPPPINSYADDFGLVFKDGEDSGIFISSRVGGIGNDDLYSFRNSNIEVAPEQKNNTDITTGADEEFKARCEPVTFDGYTYEVVQIGDQCWFAENLRSEHYANGDLISENASVPGDYGRLYNGFAAVDSRNLCPTSWHVPSDTEMNINIGISVNCEALKSSWRDFPAWNGSNASGFSALPGGYLRYDGYYDDRGDAAHFWTTTVARASASMYRPGANLWSLYVQGGSPSSAYRYESEQSSFMSIRCLHDQPFDKIRNNNVDASFQSELPCEPVTFDGYTYEVVQIGDQCWFAENLRSEHYANGDLIPWGLSDKEWRGRDSYSGAQAVFGEGTSTIRSGNSNEAENLANYGRLYNGFAVGASRGICPTGWHVPTDEEFMTLEMELGMNPSEANQEGYRSGINYFMDLKSPFWYDPSLRGSEAMPDGHSFFMALPGGYRDHGGDFSDWSLSKVGAGGCFWTSSLSASQGSLQTYSGWYRVIGSESAAELNGLENERNEERVDQVGRFEHLLRNGLSVRCLRDE